MDDVLLIAAGWQFRRLVYAQLLEEGYAVLSLPSLRLALGALLHGGAPARLALLDLQGHAPSVTARQIVDLWEANGRAPLILCGGHLDQAVLNEKGLPPATVLIRPFRVGEVVHAVRRKLPWPMGTPTARAGA